MKKYFIKSSTSMLKKEIDSLRDQVEKLSTTEPTPQVQKRSRKQKTAVYSPPVELEAKIVEFDFDNTDEF